MHHGTTRPLFRSLCCEILLAVYRILAGHVGHRRVVIHSLDRVERCCDTGFNITHIVVCHSLLSRLIVGSANDVFQCVPVVHGFEYKSVITNTSLMLVEPLSVKVVPVLTRESELILAVKYKVFVVVQLVLQALDLYAHSRSPLDLTTLFLST